MFSLPALVAAFVLAQSPLADLDLHPWKGVARICISDAGQTQCEVVTSIDSFETESTCLSEMRTRLLNIASYLRRDYPSLDVRVEYACVEDRSYYNTRT